MNEAATDVSIKHITFSEQGRQKDITNALTVTQSRKRLKKENLMVLRAQVDIYRTDFEQEKAVKKNLIREKNKLIEQIQHLTLQNQDLRRNLDQFRRVQYYEGEQASLLSNSSSHKTNGNQESTNSSSSTVIQIYSCPLCGQKFSSIDPLVQHTESCIILSEQS